MQGELTPRDKILELARSPRPKYIAVRELIQLGLMAEVDVAPLGKAGLRYYTVEGAAEEPKVWVCARDFVRAAAILVRSVDGGENAVVH